MDLPYDDFGAKFYRNTVAIGLQIGIDHPQVVPRQDIWSFLCLHILGVHGHNLGWPKSAVGEAKTEKIHSFPFKRRLKMLVSTPNPASEFAYLSA